MNECGLAAHLLWLNETNYGMRQPNVPGLSVGLWVQYYLDNFQTVDEAIRFTETKAFQVVDFFYLPNTKVKVHIALEDASGDPAIIEYINGIPLIHHNRSYTTLTNSPTYDQQLENLHRYQSFGGNLLLPGTGDAKDRFVRASYYNKTLPKTEIIRDELAGIVSVMNNVSAPYQESGSRTLWQIVSDLTHKTYYFHAIGNMNMIWVNLLTLNLRPGASALKLEMINHPDLVGDVAKNFEPVNKA